MATDFSTKLAATIYSEGVYAEEFSLRPVILDLLKEVKNKKVLDLGCGDGRYSKILAERGAYVTAIDASEHQLEIARKNNSHSNIGYILGNVTNIPQISNESIDLIFANMLIPDLDDTNSLNNFIKESKRILKLTGKFIFSTMHPLYISSDQDPSDKAIDFQKDKYFDEGHTYKADAITHKGNAMHFNETHFSLNFISETLHSNGFLINRLIESKPVPEKNIFLPKYLVFECIQQYKL